MRRLAACLALAVTSTASAENYDFSLASLGQPCRVDPCPAGTQASASANFRSFARQLAAGVSSSSLVSPDTLGHSGAALAVELSVVSYTGGSLPTVAPLTGAVLTPGVRFRKGLPLSLELGVRLSWIEQSRMGVGTVELRWAINEGFRFLPDIAVRGSLTKLINARGVDLTTGGFDLSVGKRFVLAGMISLTPYAGWNLMFVGASSDRIDFRPSRTLAQSDDPTQQFVGFDVFDPVRASDNAFNRVFAGFRFTGGVFQLGGEVSYAILGSFREKAPDDTDIDVSVPGVLAFNATVGVAF